MKQLIAALALACVPAPLLWSQTARLQPAPIAGVSVAHNETRTGPGDTPGQADAELEEIDIIHIRLMEAAERMTAIYSSLNERLGPVCGTDGEWSTQPDDDEPLDELCRASVHDTLEYLELHHRMQRESRRFQALSDALKAHRGTAVDPSGSTR